MQKQILFNEPYWFKRPIFKRPVIKQKTNEQKKSKVFHEIMSFVTPRNVFCAFDNLCFNIVILYITLWILYLKSNLILVMPCFFFIRQNVVIELTLGLFIWEYILYVFQSIDEHFFVHKLERNLATWKSLSLLCLC